MRSNDIEIPRIRRPWFRQISVLSRIAFAVSMLAGVVELFVLAFAAAPIGGFVAIVTAMAGVLVSRRYPWVGLLLVLAGVVLDAVFWDPLVIWTMAVFTVFAMALRGASAFGAGIVTGAVAFGASVYANNAGLFDPAAISGFFASVTAAAIGNAIRNRDRYWTAQDERARDAIAAREVETHRRVVEERLRIARDLHDVVGHEVAVISMNLGVAEVSLPTGSEKSRRAIESARAGVQAVLHETQSILNVLREGAEDEYGDNAVPGVARLSELVDSYRSIGLQVNAQISVDAANLDPTVDVAVYRIVQEALTNSHRHGDGAVRLEISSTREHVLVDVSNHRNAGAPLRPEGSGLGLVGMRERVTSAGGSLEVDDNGHRFCVRARVPAQGRQRR
ncbi:MAG TPA: histidine kinase [Aldersonia sp.]